MTITVEFLSVLVLDLQMTMDCLMIATRRVRAVYNERRLPPMSSWRAMPCRLARKAAERPELTRGRSFRRKS